MPLSDQKCCSKNLFSTILILTSQERQRTSKRNRKVIHFQGWEFQEVKRWTVKLWSSFTKYMAINGNKSAIISPVRIILLLFLAPTLLSKICSIPWPEKPSEKSMSILNTILNLKVWNQRFLNWISCLN